MPTQCNTGPNDAVIIWAQGKLFFKSFLVSASWPSALFCFLGSELLVAMDTKPRQCQPMMYAQMPPSKPAMSLLTPPTTPKTQGQWPGSESTPNNPAPVPCLWATAHREDYRCSLSMMMGGRGRDDDTNTNGTSTNVDRMTTRTIERGRWWCLQYQTPLLQTAAHREKDWCIQGRNENGGVRAQHPTPAAVSICLQEGSGANGHITTPYLQWQRVGPWQPGPTTTTGPLTTTASNCSQGGDERLKGWCDGGRTGWWQEWGGDDAMAPDSAMSNCS